MRALVLSDIHANLEALNAVLDAAGDFDLLWDLGDVVGYGASPNEVVERVRGLSGLHVRGNHDRVCGGYASAVSFNPVARAAAVWTNQQLIPENLAWINALEQGPLLPVSLPEEGVIACAHGSPLEEDSYIASVRDAWSPIREMAATTTFFGHTHLQGGFLLDGTTLKEMRPRFVANDQAASVSMVLEPGLRYLINPGSVGQPRDGDWRAAFILYDTDSKTVTFHRVPYDLTVAQGRILMAGLPERLASRLREGR